MQRIKSLSKMDIDRIVKNTRASLVAEGLQPSSYSTRLGRRMLRGEITENQAIEAIIKKHLR